jgi:hypothetical protein
VLQRAAQQDGQVLRGLRVQHLQLFRLLFACETVSEVKKLTVAHRRLLRNRDETWQTWLFVICQGRTKL